jgi:CRP-like cAMP-binding protein
MSKGTTKPSPAADLSAFLRALRALAPLPEEATGILLSCVERRTLTRGDFLVRQGETVDWLGFLTRGLVRTFRHQGANEVTLGFSCEERFVGAFDAFVTHSAVGYSIQALEDGMLMRIRRDDIERLNRKVAGWAELSNALLEHLLARRVDKELRIRTRTPEERYLELLRSDSYLVRRVPQYLLASFLGITPEALGRIRARSGDARLQTS